MESVEQGIQAEDENLNKEENITRDVVLGFKQPSHDFLRGTLICGPGIGPSGIHPRPLELKRIMPKITRTTEDSLSKSKRFAMEQSASYVLYRQVERATDICPVVQVNQTQRNRVVNLMCRIYVAGIGFDVREDTVRLAFSPFGPIRRVDMSWDTATQNKGYAFVEYEVPDSAELALDQMHDTMISGRPIKVTRPCNAPSTQGMIDGILDEARPYARVFVANIHPQIHSRDLRSVFETFGKVRSCVIIGERNPVHKGIAYIEFEDQACANDSIVSLNCFTLGGQSLRVGKAVTLASHIPEDKGLPPAAALAMAAVTAKLQGRQNIPTKPTETALVKKSKEDSILNMPPMESLVSAIVSPAMVQAGLSDVAADLVNSTDIQTLISPSAFKPKMEVPRKQKKEKPKQSLKNKEEEHKSPETKPKDGDQNSLKQVNNFVANSDKEANSPKEKDNHVVTSTNGKPHNNSKRTRSRSRSHRRKDPLERRRKSSRSSLVPSRVEKSHYHFDSPQGRRKRSRSLHKYDDVRSYERKRRSRSKSHPKRRDVSKRRSSRDIDRHRSRSIDHRKERTRSREKKYRHRSRDRHSRHQRSKSHEHQISTLEDISIKGGNARLLVMQKLARNLQTNVILLRNLVPSDQVDENLRQELNQECSRYGTVKQVLINQERQGSASDAPKIVKIFVQFQNSECIS